MNVFISVRFPYAASAAKSVTNANWTHLCDVCDSDLPIALDFMILTVSPGILSI